MELSIHFSVKEKLKNATLLEIFLGFHHLFQIKIDEV